MTGRHRRFGVSRRERFEKIEKAALKPLPQCGVRRRRVEDGEAASRLLRRRRRRLLQRAAHPSTQEAANQDHREPCRDLLEPRAPGDPSAEPAENGQRIRILEHFPANSMPSTRRRRRNCCRSRASSIPTSTRCSSSCSMPTSTLICVAPGLGARHAPRKSVVPATTLASVHIVTAIATMRRYNRIRTPYFQDLLKQAQRQSRNPQPIRDIVRRPGNPFLRYVGGAALQATDEPSIPPTAAQEKLPL